jgi:cytochrome c-type biogenesis protein CcmH
LLTQVDARTAASLRPQINAARAAADMPPLQVTEETTPGQAASSLIVHVSLDPGLAAGQTFGSDASVFVIARIPDGPPMPVAVERHSLRDLPLQLTLDDADSPMPTQKLSTLKQVELVARISISGNATRQEGDLESKPVRVTLPAQAPVELVIGKHP